MNTLYVMLIDMPEAEKGLSQRPREPIELEQGITLHQTLIDQQSLVNLKNGIES